MYMSVLCCQFLDILISVKCRRWYYIDIAFGILLDSDPNEQPAAANDDDDDDDDDEEDDEKENDDADAPAKGDELSNESMNMLWRYVLRFCVCFHIRSGIRNEMNTYNHSSLILTHCVLCYV